ncbi:hypothetical protein L1987_78369 [Smallanthus sonchifolius]|uniref:Uncharacterized protein n=1 Tax=Smallanthus sonchifolius TaxID=185202 RepID=A0ACB8ZC67_9ASTR|nr:hypothetical protein L1987_78369 [Smallanthus sonchifolius]
MLIRDAQLKIIERRFGKASVTVTEGKIRMPGSTFFRNTTPLELDRTPGTDRFAKEELFNAVKESIKNDDDGAVDTNSLSLDEFFRKYTSEDNDSFLKLIEKVNKNKRLRSLILKAFSLLCAEIHHNQLKKQWQMNLQSLTGPFRSVTKYGLDNMHVFDMIQQKSKLLQNWVLFDVQQVRKVTVFCA